MAGRLVICAVVFLSLCVDATCSDDGACQLDASSEEGVSNSLFQKQLTGMKHKASMKRKMGMKHKMGMKRKTSMKHKMAVQESTWALDEGTYMLENGTCVLDGVPVTTVTYVEVHGKYFSKECLPVCIKVTEAAKQTYANKESELQALAVKLDTSEKDLIAAEAKLLDLQTEENELKVIYDDSWSLPKDDRKLPKKDWEAAVEMTEEQQDVVIELSDSFEKNMHDYKTFVQARDVALLAANAKSKAAATCAMVTIPIGLQANETAEAKNGTAGANATAAANGTAKPAAEANETAEAAPDLPPLDAAPSLKE